jgi:hypothetical protein
MATRIPAAEGNPANRRIDRPQDVQKRRHQAQADAASRLDVDAPRLGAELAADPRPHEESETADALKRTAENEGRT